MANPGRPKGGGPTPTSWKPGTSGNPGGRPTGARDKITKEFLNALADDFSDNGKEAIQKMRLEEPASYIRVLASLVPKELNVGNPILDEIEQMSDEEIRDRLAELREEEGLPPDPPRAANVH